MAIVELLRGHLQRLHRSYEEAVQGLTPEQLHWRPGKGCNHIAFTIWHYARTADNVSRFVLQNRRPTVWTEGGWDKKFGLDRAAQGTGMSQEEATAIRLPSVEAFLPYMQRVWRAVDEYLNSINDDALSKIVTIRPQGELPVGQILTTVLLTHGFSHLGELWMLRGLQGFKGSPI